MGKFCYEIAIVAVLVLVFGNLVIEGSSQDTSCINRLVPCLNYLNGTKDVPKSCCDPLENVIKSDSQCLCSMISNRGSNQAQQAGINVTEAQQLPGRCGLHVNPIACLTDSPRSRNSGDKSSAAFLLFPTCCFMVATAFFIALQILV